MEIRKALKTDIYEIIELTEQLGCTVNKNNFINQFNDILEKSDHAIFIAEDILKMIFDAHSDFGLYVFTEH